MDESALKTLIESLEAHRTALDWWLSFWTWLVVIGVVLEVVFVIRTYLKEREDWARGNVHAPDRPSKRWLFLELAGVALVALGVAGELSVDAKIGVLETQIRGANDKRTVLLESESGDAKTSADGALAALKEANKQLDEIDRKTNAAGLKADAVSQKAEQIDAQLAETQWAFSMRTLSSIAERDKIIEQLKQFHGKTVFVRSYRYMGDVDGFRICKMVIDLAHSAGMNPIDQCSTLLPGEIPAVGIQVCGPNDDQMLSLSGTLSRIDVGTTCPFGAVPHSADLIVNVGSKALGGIGETFQTEDAERRAAAMKKKSKTKAKP
jgi:hypothetical protein